MALKDGRNEATRTPDPYVPNVVRYQLRYIPMQCFLNCAAKVDIFSKPAKFIIKKACNPVKKSSQKQ